MSTDTEERVRRALAARAAQVTPERLQPAVPPTATVARRSWRPWWRTLLVTAAVLVAVVISVRRPGDPPPRPLPNPPAATVPSTSVPDLGPIPSPAATSEAPPAPRTSAAATPTRTAVSRTRSADVGTSPPTGPAATP
jgi:hypothetical protein